jgi:hypothetical protein
MFDTRPGRKRGIERPKRRWGHSVDQDIKLLGERNWKSLALNREERKKLSTIHRLQEPFLHFADALHTRG